MDDLTNLKRFREIIAAHPELARSCALSMIALLNKMIANHQQQLECVDELRAATRARLDEIVQIRKEAEWLLENK